MVLSCMTCMVNFVFLPSHSSKVLSGDGLVGGNPTMNTPWLRRGGGIAPSSFVFYLYWYSCIVYFVCDSASEFGAMGSTSFLGLSYLLGLSYPNLLLLVFLNLLFFRNLYHISVASVGTFSAGLLFFFFIFLYLILG